MLCVQSLATAAPAPGLVSTAVAGRRLQAAPSGAQVQVIVTAPADSAEAIRNALEAAVSSGDLQATLRREGMLLDRNLGSSSHAYLYMGWPIEMPSALQFSGDAVELSNDSELFGFQLWAFEDVELLLFLGGSMKRVHCSYFS